ncbi:MAG: hypothetical protein M8353_03225 [ANME-2 cluster archaeon]|nr:hypothetical protein [ANME-2 cluster archaeon]
MKSVLLIIIILGILFSGCVSANDLDSSVYTGPIFETVNQNVVNGVISVNAGEYVYYQLSLPSQAKVSGDFTAFGGSGNDIIVLILDENAYINWINGHSVSAYYNSGQMTTDSISASLPKGNYYLIYSNAFSSFSNKNVNTNVVVSYSICVENCGS